MIRLGLVMVLLLSAPAAAQPASDPVGAIAQTARYEGGHGVFIGRDAGGRPVCFRREQGDSHRLDIGIGLQGAFVRLETPEPREQTVREPIAVFAGQRGQGDRFTALATFTGTASHHVPRANQSGFVLIAADRAAFLAVVAAARDHFLVVQSRQAPAGREYVAVYEFDRAAADAVLACAARHVR